MEMLSQPTPQGQNTTESSSLWGNASNNPNGFNF